MKFRRVIVVVLLCALFCSVLTVVSSADTDVVTVDESDPVETTDLKDDPSYVDTKGSIFDLVYTFWYWIFGDAFDTSDKICALLSVISIVWAIYLLIPKRKAV